MFEATFESAKSYENPFRDVDLDVHFTDGTQSWRVPAFWRGANRWGVRFAPPSAGRYSYRIQCSDLKNGDLNQSDQIVEVDAYEGPNRLLKRGPFRVSASGRFFEHRDGTPFYWLGDTWYTGLSDRLSWEAFQTLTADRKAKGYSAVHIAVMTVSNEEDAPFDPGFCNEGGRAWDAGFERLNPAFFDYADRRIAHLVEAEIAPVIFGAWRQALAQMGLETAKKFWRYIIARYGAYPVFWVAGGEVYDNVNDPRRGVVGWTDLVRYIRETDPYHHPLAVHELPPSMDTAITDESLSDFDLFQPSHSGWASIRAEIVQLNMHYARTHVKKPLIVGEVGWETLGGHHYEDLQRMAFWLAMLNGAAGFAYGNAITGLAYDVDKPFHRIRFSFLRWDEAMNFPASNQLGIAAALLQGYPWQRLEPRPDWISPGGPTFLDPQSEVGGFDIDLIGSLGKRPEALDREFPSGAWQTRDADFRLPYAAGIPGTLRIIYIPSTGFPGVGSPTVLKLEPGIVYRAYYWEPTLGVKVDLGKVEAGKAGEVVHTDTFEAGSVNWDHALGRSECTARGLLTREKTLLVLRNVWETDALVSVEAETNADVGLVLRYRDSDNYTVATYYARTQSIGVVVRRDGTDSGLLGRTPIPFKVDARARLCVEVKGNSAIVSLVDEREIATSPIVDIAPLHAPSDVAPAFKPGRVGLLASDDQSQCFTKFEVRRCAVRDSDETLDRELYDARGTYRGALRGKNWDAYGRNKDILLDAYRPERPPFPQDWVLVLEAI
ncbi:DUF5060 domain-containing protein [Terricaulis silvestris]|uniref:Endoglucanase n=1 Tax=Terricaulis silvestris TaxID=2686094 RepID=A0A6I6MNM9_9CAUL|nr:DUF5060 domain-containing protein [Terricaulis silvestris]QGZ94936.1 Putative endoglucanase [Terricaulis silvestris]